MTGDVWLDLDVRAWLLTRLDAAGSMRFGSDRTVGVSSNAMVNHVLTGLPVPKDRYPRDLSDLRACVNARNEAPPIVRPVMDTVLTDYAASLVTDTCPDPLAAVGDLPVSRGILLTDAADLFDDEDENKSPAGDKVPSASEGGGCAAVVDAVLALHRPCTDPDVEPGGRWCVECVRGWDADDFDLVRWPCPTATAVASAAGVDVP